MTRTDNHIAGKRIVVTRPRSQAAGLIGLLESAGAVPLSFPTIDTTAVADTMLIDEEALRVATYDWVIFTSVNGVNYFWERLNALQQVNFPHDVKVAAIGPATALALEARGITASYIPDKYVAEYVAQGLPCAGGAKILLPRAAIARKDLAILLRERGATVTEVATYETVQGQPTADEWSAIKNGFDILTFTSSSTVKNFAALCGEQLPSIVSDAVVACIGPITAETCIEFGLIPDIVADEYTSEGLVDAIVSLAESGSASSK